MLSPSDSFHFSMTRTEIRWNTHVAGKNCFRISIPQNNNPWIVLKFHNFGFFQIQWFFQVWKMISSFSRFLCWKPWPKLPQLGNCSTDLKWFLTSFVWWVWICTCRCVHIAVTLRQTPERGSHVTLAGSNAMHSQGQAGMDKMSRPNYHKVTCGRSSFQRGMISHKSKKDWLLTGVRN